MTDTDEAVRDVHARYREAMEKTDRALRAVCDENDRLTLDNERLRGALKTVVKEDVHYGNLGRLGKFAKAALEENKP